MLFENNSRFSGPFISCTCFQMKVLLPEQLFFSQLRIHRIIIKFESRDWYYMLPYCELYHNYYCINVDPKKERHPFK